MSTLVITDIGELITAAGHGTGEQALGLVHGAEVVIVDGVVRSAGPAGQGPLRTELSGEVPGEVIVRSAEGRLVSPGLCDPHTHPIWAGDRSLEFDLRNQGKSYAEIQQAGGGILSTVTATSAASDDELLRLLDERLWRMLRHGTTRCEAKTGYGLLPEAELRLLGLLLRAAQGHPVVLSPTLLCHVPPPGLGAAERHRLVADLAALLPVAVQQGARAVDVYCDQGAFTLEETEWLLRAGQEAGLLLRCHAEQFTHTGAAALAASLGAASVEHLEEIDDDAVLRLARSGTVANLLPGAALMLRLPWPPARRLIDAGVCVALGTDLNPGTSLTESQPLMMMLGCSQMGLTCAEAWQAVTVHAARALGDPAAGQLRPGAPGDLVIWEAEGYREVCQHFGGTLCQEVYVAGKRRYPDLS